MITVATFPALVQSFFMDRLMQQRQASPHTIASYRDTFRLLLQFAQQRLGKAPTSLAVQTGLRAAELTNLRCEDIVLGAGAHVRCEGKGRKRRCTPLRKDTVRVLRDWLREQQGQPSAPLFPTMRGTALSHDALQDLLDKHLAVARRRCPSLARKRVTPHVLRHTLAMELLHEGAGQTVIALWLGHESPETTSVYLHADMQLKERALAATTARKTSVPRFRPSDRLLTLLKNL